MNTSLESEEISNLEPVLKTFFDHNLQRGKDVFVPGRSSQPSIELASQAKKEPNLKWSTCELLTRVGSSLTHKQ